LRGDQAGITEQGNRTGEEIVQVLDGDVDRACVVYLDGYGLLVGIGVAAEGGQEVAYPAFCRKVTAEEAEALSIIRVAWFL
jgi:hypothetical protein